MRTLVVLAVSLLAISAVGRSDTQFVEKDVLVGVNYFAGWWEELPNKWHGHGWTAAEPDWRERYPDRVPSLGSFNDQATMDREIMAAADHGVDFFSILWYFAERGDKESVNAQRLNRGLENFLKSPQAHRLRFMVEFCNHASFSPSTDAQWAGCVKTWVEAMRHPSCLRVGGRLVFKVHDIHQFWLHGDKNFENCQRRLNVFRQAVRDAGLGEMIIGGGITSRVQVRPEHPAAKLFDFTATYMGVPTLEPRETEYPYARLAEEARTARPLHARDALPWVPYLAVGWNPRPWTDPKAEPHHRTFFAFPTRQEWMAELQAMYEDLKRYPALGLPLPNGGRQKAFTTYAWNEFGEGGILAPTRADGEMKLECIAEVSGCGWSGVATDAHGQRFGKVIVENVEVPELGAWGKRAGELCVEWYPKIDTLLASDGFRPPQTVRVRFLKDKKGVASTSTDIISVSSRFVKSHPDDAGMIIHELTHVVQAYPEPKKGCTKPGWLVEGIADYIRLYHFEPNARRPSINPQKASYRDSYKTTAAFLAWVEKTYSDKTPVRKLNQALRDGRFTESLFVQITGKSVDELWQAFAGTLPAISAK